MDGEAGDLAGGDGVSATSVIRSMIATGIERGIPAAEQYVLVPAGIFERLWDEVARGFPVSREDLDHRIVVVDGARVYGCGNRPQVLTEAQAGLWLAEQEAGNVR